MFTQAELERTNHDMQARLLSVSEQILHELARLERHIEEVPMGARSTVLAAAAQIASTQRRVQDQAHHLPSSPLRRFQILRSSLDAQQGALRHLSIIVRRHAPVQLRQATPVHLPPRAQEPHRVPAAPAHRTPRDQRIPAEVPHAAAPAPRSPVAAPMRPDPAWPHPESDALNSPQPRPPIRASRNRGAVVLPASARKRLHTAIERARLWSLALVAILAGSAVLSYGMFPSASEQRDLSARRVALAPPSAAPLAEPPAPPAAIPSPPAPTLPTLPAPMRDLGEQAAGTDASSPPASPPPSQPFISGVTVGVLAPAVAAPIATAALPADRPALQPPAPAAGQVGTVAPPKQKHAAKLEAEPAAKVRFVPVVFTHKDDTAAMRAFGDLQRQYPKLLGHRQGQAQPVDLGSKGIWHRLVVLPPGARPQATKLCDQLLTAGYDRCWVKAY